MSFTYTLYRFPDFPRFLYGKFLLISDFFEKTFLEITHYDQLSGKIETQILKNCIFRLIVLILIRKSISSMKRHLEKMTDRLPYHFDDDMGSNHSASSPHINAKDTTMDTMVGHCDQEEAEVAKL